VTAPFAGTVASVQIKTGDTVAPNTVALSLNSGECTADSGLFFRNRYHQNKSGRSGRSDARRIRQREAVCGAVVSVDTAPSPTSDAAGAPLGYKATLQFLKTDPAITSGMSANITIPLQ